MGFAVHLKHFRTTSRMEINYYSGYSIRKYPYCQEVVCEFSDNIVAESASAELLSETHDSLYFTRFCDLIQDRCLIVYCIIYSILCVKIIYNISH